jgi:ABC-type glycerol-3-phosphate transport system substrate-binding protein
MKVTPLFALLVVVGAITALEACGGGSSSPSPPPPPTVTITSVTVSPNSSNLVVQFSQQFTATVN